jgi:hypothetical protein
MPILESELDAHFEERWKDFECRCPYQEPSNKDFLVTSEPPSDCPYFLEQTVSRKQDSILYKAWVFYRLWRRVVCGSRFKFGYSSEFGRFW